MSTDQPPERLPTLAIGWNAELQAVSIKFDPLDFKTWDFVVATLDMAKQWAEHQRDIQRMANLQLAQQQAAQANNIRRNLRMG